MSSDKKLLDVCIKPCNKKCSEEESKSSCPNRRNEVNCPDSQRLKYNEKNTVMSWGVRNEENQCQGGSYLGVQCPDKINNTPYDKGNNAEEKPSHKTGLISFRSKSKHVCQPSESSKVTCFQTNPCCLSKDTCSPCMTPTSSCEEEKTKKLITDKLTTRVKNKEKGSSTNTSCTPTKKETQNSCKKSLSDISVICNKRKYSQKLRDSSFKENNCQPWQSPKASPLLSKSVSCSNRSLDMKNSCQQMIDTYKGKFPGIFKSKSKDKFIQLFGPQERESDRYRNSVFLFKIRKNYSSLFIKPFAEKWKKCLEKDASRKLTPKTPDKYVFESLSPPKVVECPPSKCPGMLYPKCSPIKLPDVPIYKIKPKSEIKPPPPPPEPSHFCSNSNDKTKLTEECPYARKPKPPENSCTGYNPCDDKIPTCPYAPKRSKRCYSSWSKVHLQITNYNHHVPVSLLHNTSLKYIVTSDWDKYRSNGNDTKVNSKLDEICPTKNDNKFSPRKCQTECEMKAAKPLEKPSPPKCEPLQTTEDKECESQFKKHTKFVCPTYEEENVEPPSKVENTCPAEENSINNEQQKSGEETTRLLWKPVCVKSKPQSDFMKFCSELQKSKPAFEKFICPRSKKDTRSFKKKSRYSYPKDLVCPSSKKVDSCINKKEVSEKWDDSCSAVQDSCASEKETEGINKKQSCCQSLDTVCIKKEDVCASKNEISCPPNEENLCDSKEDKICAPEQKKDEVCGSDQYVPKGIKPAPKRDPYKRKWDDYSPDYCPEKMKVTAYFHVCPPKESQGTQDKANVCGKLSMSKPKNSLSCVQKEEAKVSIKKKAVPLNVRVVYIEGISKPVRRNSKKSSENVSCEMQSPKGVEKMKNRQGWCQWWSQ